VNWGRAVIEHWNLETWNKVAIEVGHRKKLVFKHRQENKEALEHWNLLNKVALEHFNLKRGTAQQRSEQLGSLMFIAGARAWHNYCRTILK
jgi:hypothetical protein